MELTASSSDKEIRLGCVVAYATNRSRFETLTVVAEVHKNTLTNQYSSIVENIQKEIAARFQLIVNDVYLIPPKTIPKTTSGKLQRLHCQELIETNVLKPLYHYVREQDSTSGITSQADPGTSWIAILKKIPTAEQELKLKELITRLTAKVLVVQDATLLDVNKSFFELGLDSVMVMDLKSTLQEQLGGEADLNNTEFLDNLSISSLTRLILSKINRVEPGTNVQQVNLGSIDSLTETDLDTLLQKEIKNVISLSNIRLDQLKIEERRALLKKVLVEKRLKYGSSR